MVITESLSSKVLHPTTATKTELQNFTSIRTKFTKFHILSKKNIKTQTAILLDDQKPVLVRVSSIKNSFTNFHSSRPELYNEPITNEDSANEGIETPLSLLDHRPIAGIFTKQVDRKEFLAYLGSVALALTGIVSLMRILSDPSGKSYHGSNNVHGFGYGAYGGPPNKN
jgi:hypothetical protein